MAFYEDGFAVLGNHCINWRTGKVLRELKRTQQFCSPTPLTLSSNEMSRHEGL